CSIRPERLSTGARACGFLDGPRAATAQSEYIFTTNCPINERRARGCRGAMDVETDDWKDTTVVVTGAARGQGAAEAALFAEAGANVVAADVDADAVSATAADVGGRVRGVGLDVTSGEDWRRLVDDLAGEPPVRVL